MVIEELHIDGYEQVIHATDEESGLDCYVAIHSTALGPAMGGLRHWCYPSTEDALTDVLRLSEGMTLKNALAKISYGGGKAVINGIKTREKLLAFGEVLNYLNGQYITAEDVGTNVQDMITINGVSSFLFDPGVGDPSPATAMGVLRAMEACLDHYEEDERVPFSNLTIAIQGLGHVGFTLAQMLAFKGAYILAADINEEACNRLLQEIPSAKILHPDDILFTDAMITSPCALGAILNADSIPDIQSPIVCGSANNQLRDYKEDGQSLHDRGILYGPDYLVNAGGVINVARESGNVSSDFHVAIMLDDIYERMMDCLLKSESMDIPTNKVADHMARYFLGE